MSDSRPPREVDPDDVTLVGRPTRDVEVERVSTTSGHPPLPDEVVPPPPFETVEDPAGPRVVTENERVRVEDDGTVTRRVDRIEHEPPRRTRRSLVPALLIILALALGAIAGAWYFTRTSNETVPSVEGLALDAAVARVQDDGFKTDIVSQQNEAAEGTVFHQSPSGGSTADKGSTVQLLVSKGPADVTVPNTVGVSETDARDRLAAVGLTASVTKVFSDVDQGQVVAQDPAGGTSAAKGTTVRLNVSKGSKLVTVPSVVGTTQSDATAQVTAAGLTPNVVQVPSTEPAGTVVAQHPVGGQAERGSPVRLNVSRGQ